MKRIVTLFAALVLCGGIYAQDLSFGLRLGPNFSQIDGDEASGYNKIGYHIGIFTSYPFSSISSANLELSYTSKGARNTSIQQVTFLDYVEISLLYGIKLTEKIEILAGVQPSVLVNSSVTEGGMDMGDVFDYKKMDIPIAIGLRLYLNPHIAFEGRLSYSLPSINRIGAAEGLLGNYGQFNNVLSGSLIYKL